ncbi:tetratricopeptide repeat protein [Streptomyces sp. NPDC006430]|uniref:ATP-binding protein n=1 Tax=Streptomyces sp. NPDC006430 TaxID=3154299 RepID=UPI0033AAC2C4
MEGHAHGESRVFMAGRDLYQTVHTSPAPEAITALRTLPRDVALFTGREDELRQLLQTATPGRTVAIHTVDGMPGVGKTTLATHAAHLLADRYPDGQLYIRLHAHTPGQRSADPADVLAALLTSIGVRPQQLPDGLEARAALWRDRLAGRRMVIVMDDAENTNQVEPLLPGSEGCLAIITSRRRLAALDGAVPLSLSVMPPDDAASLFIRLTHRTPPGPGPERDAVDEAVRLCGFLPLAIALLAARLAQHPTWSIAEYTADFAAAQDRLGELEAGDRAVAAAFDLSYRELPADRQCFLRRLGLHPGHDIDVYAAAALDGVPIAQARRHLSALYANHLVDEPTRGRYRLHDLIREYARSLAEQDPAEDRAQAVGRLFAYYQHTAEAADRQYADARRPDTPAVAEPPPAAPGLAGREQALAWMRAERVNLLACTQYAVAHARHSDVVRFTLAVNVFLRLEGPWHQGISLLGTGISAARLLGDRLSEANALWSLGWMQRVTGDYPAAADLAGQALAHYQSLGEPLGEANTLRDLGRVRRMTGDYPAAADLAERALAHYQSLGDRLGEANTLWDLAWARRMTGEYEESAARAEQALALYRSLGARLGEANALWDLGWVRRLTGDGPAAVDLTEQALTLYRSLSDRLGEANALWSLGEAKRLTGDHQAAVELEERALELYRALDVRLGEAHTLRDLGRLRRLTGDFQAAAEMTEQALTLFRSLGDRLGEAEVLNSKGALLAETSTAYEALDQHRQALRIARQVHSPLEEARALEGAARCAARTGALPAARAELREAVGIYQRIGAAEAPSAGAYLTSL